MASHSKAESSELPNAGDKGASAEPADGNQDDKVPLYSQRYLRIPKEQLFMILSLWMQDFPSAENDSDPKPYKRSGAALVLPNDVLYAVDCSRGGVHAVARLLMKHHDMPKGCKVFVSRRPCALCAKLLVQSKVSRVLYLPFQPEYGDSKEEASQVDKLFKASEIGESMFVPKVEKAVLQGDELRLQKKRKRTPEEKNEEMKKKKEELFEYYRENIGLEADWPGIDFDQHLKDQVKYDFKDTMEWIARKLVLPSTKADKFSQPPFFSKGSHPENTPGKTHFGSTSQASDQSFNPITNTLHEQQAVRLMQMASFLADRSDDPKTGVGAIIVDERMEVKAFGWNGFPLKALYGEFPRASDDDDQNSGTKYPYVIHAEQNALLMRNDKKLDDSILFVTKSPCNECTPLIEMAGVKTVVIGEESNWENLSRRKAEGRGLGYNLLPEKVEAKRFVMFERKVKVPDHKDMPVGNKTRKKLIYKIGGDAPGLE